MKLWQQVLVGLFLGILVGFIINQNEEYRYIAEYLKILGTIFISLIKMVVIPLIVFSLLSGITGIGNSERFGRIGFKSVVAFLLTALFAVNIGLVAGSVFKPGEGLQVHFNEIPSATHEAPKVGEMLLGIIPTNVFKSMTEDNILQILIFTVFVGISLNIVRDKAKHVIQFCQEMAQVTFKMIEMIVKLSPYGVFGFISWIVGTQGFDVLEKLIVLVLVVLGACLLQYLIFGVLIIVFARVSPMPFYRKMVEPQALAFSTSSSKATLSTAMRVLKEKLGVSENSTNFVLPLGAAMNMDGTAIYLGICALFFAQATGVTLEAHDYFTLMLTCTLASIGAAGIPGGSLIFMGMVLHSVGLPIEGIALIAGVDRILDMVRTTINITGDSAITLIIDKTEKTLDEKQYYA